MRTIATVLLVAAFFQTAALAQVDERVIAECWECTRSFFDESTDVKGSVVCPAATALLQRARLRSLIRPLRSR